MRGRRVWRRGTGRRRPPRGSLCARIPQHLGRASAGRVRAARLGEQSCRKPGRAGALARATQSGGCAGGTGGPRTKAPGHARLAVRAAVPEPRDFPAFCLHGGGGRGEDPAVRKCYQPRIVTAFLPPPAPFPFLPSPSNRFQQFPKRKRRGGRVERKSQRSGARLTLSLSPSRATAGQEDLEDAQQEVHGRGGAAVAAGLRASEPRHAAASAPLGARRARR